MGRFDPPTIYGAKDNLGKKDTRFWEANGCNEPFGFSAGHQPLASEESWFRYLRGPNTLELIPMKIAIITIVFCLTACQQVSQDDSKEAAQSSPPTESLAPTGKGPPPAWNASSALQRFGKHMENMSPEDYVDNGARHGGKLTISDWLTRSTCCIDRFRKKETEQIAKAEGITLPQIFRVPAG